MSDVFVQDEVIKLRNKYRVYIDTHRNNVALAWKNMKSNDICEDTLGKCVEIYNGKIDVINLVNLMNTVSANVRSHDQSKYSDMEFEPYRKNFFPVDEKEKEENVQDFEKALQHHYENNMHHWNWWANNNQKEKMPLSFVVEMAMDWIAMSMIYSDSNALEWYRKQENIVLGEKQKKCVELILKMYYTQFNTLGGSVLK